MSVIIDGTNGVTASASFYGQSTFTGTYTDGIVVDYTTGMGRISVGASDGLAFYNAGVATTELMRLNASGNLGLGVVPSAWASPFANGVFEFSGGFLAPSAANQTFRLGQNHYYNGSSYVYKANGPASAYLQNSGAHQWLNAPTGTAGNAITFTQAMTLDTSGNLLVGVSAWTDGGGGSFIGNRASAGINGKFSCSSTSNQVIFYFTNPNGVVGLIQASGSTTAYVTSSDYRLKENVQPMQNALGVVQQLKPCTYTWKADGSAGQGFIAHELAEVCPDAVAGEKDAVNEDGSIKPQGIDTSFLVATLTAAIQEQQAIIEQLRADVAQLKGKA